MRSLLLLLLAAALAAPPSSRLSGSAGALTWTVTETDGGVRVDGRSPRWTVTHTATAALRPLRTERVSAEGVRHVVVYDAQGATVTGPSGEVRFDAPGLWDGDTVDVRLGQLVAEGRLGADGVRFDAIDLGGGKLYTFQASADAPTTCGSASCTPVTLSLAGVLRLVGPTWRYWYAADGRLLRFDGPAGLFVAPGVPAAP